MSFIATKLIENSELLVYQYDRGGFSLYERRFDGFDGMERPVRVGMVRDSEQKLLVFQKIGELSLLELKLRSVRERADILSIRLLNSEGSHGFDEMLDKRRYGRHVEKNQLMEVFYIPKNQKTRIAISQELTKPDRGEIKALVLSRIDEALAEKMGELAYEFWGEERKFLSETQKIPELLNVTVPVSLVR